MKVLDLFSGIGGFSLGLGRAGMETVQFCEIDNYCQKVLAKHWPGIPIHDDIRTLDGEQFRGAVGVVCGGFPCQPFSSAGKRAGKNDDRDLWPEMYRIIREVQPAWVVGENVAGFVDMELDRTLSDLENSGYACQTFEIPACAVAAHHQRMRVWIVAQRTDADPGGAGERDTGERIVADANSERLRKQQEPELRGSRAPESVIDGEKQLVADPKGERHREAGADFQRSEKRPAGSGSAQNKVDVANAERSRHKRQRESKQPSNSAKARSREAIKSWDGGEPRVWALEPDVGRVVDGVPDRVDRLKGLGNAVVPQIPEIIGRAIMEQHA